MVAELPGNGWAEPENMSIQPCFYCLSLRIVGYTKTVHGYLLRCFGGIQQDMYAPCVYMYIFYFLRKKTGKEEAATH
jgi:hypothetical protein